MIADQPFELSIFFSLASLGDALYKTAVATAVLCSLRKATERITEHSARWAAVFTAASHPGRAGGPGCDEPLTKLKVRVGGPGQSGEPEARSRRVGGPGDPGTRGRGEQHPTDALGGGVEQRVRRAAQRQRLPGDGTPPRARTRRAHQQTHF